MQIIAEVRYFKHCRCGTQIYHVKSMWLTPAEKQILPAVIGKKWSCLQNKGQLRYRCYRYSFGKTRKHKKIYLII